MAKTKNPTNGGRPQPTAPLRPPDTDVQDAPGILYFRIGVALSLLVSLVTYLLTMAPSATFWDAGEFIASSYTLGVPHSPGTPLYVLIGRVFTLLPLPFSLAGRVNFMSVASATLGAMFVYLLIVRFMDYMVGRSQTLTDTLTKVTAGLVGAFFITFSHTYWANAVESEVYALSTFIMGMMTWLGLKWAESPTGSHARAFIYFVFYLLALSVGLHLGTILAFSGIFFLVLMTPQKTFTNLDFFLACFGIAVFVADATLYRNGTFTVWMLVAYAIILLWHYRRTKSLFPVICTALFVLGVSVHLYLTIRSMHNPMIDEGDPESWRWLYAAIRREQYPPSNIFVRKASFAFQLQHFNGYFQEQFQMVSSYIGKLNMGSIVPIGLGIWGMVDQFSKNRKSWIMLFVTFVVMSLGMIVYLNFSDTEVRERDYFYLPAFYYFAIYIGIGVGSMLGEIRQFAARKSLPVNALVGVPAVLLLICPILTAKMHYWRHDLSNNYVTSHYARNMLIGLEQNSLLFTNGDNDTFPLWYIQEVEGYRKDVRVVNLSLLNTPWYLKQLRDNEPKVDMTWTDADLYSLRPVRTQDGVLWIRDLGVQHILKNNGRTRPIYFAVTIPPGIYEPYRSFLEMEGLGYRVVPRQGEAMVNVAKLEENIWQKYNFEGLLTADYKRDDSMYHPPFVSRLVQNYAAAFTQLAFAKVQEEDFCGAVRNLEVAREIAPQLPQIVATLGWYYLQCGDTTKALQFYEGEYQAANDPGRVDLLYRKAGIEEQIRDLRAALVTLERIMAINPDFREAALSATGIAMNFKEYDRAVGYLDRWIMDHPTDDAMKTERENLVRQIQASIDQSEEPAQPNP